MANIVNELHNEKLSKLFKLFGFCLGNFPIKTDDGLFSL